jgi:hypothetical protein
VILPSSNLPSLVADRLNWTPAQISPLLVTFGIIVVLMQLVVLPLLLRRFQEIHLAIVGGSIAGLGFFLVGLFPITGDFYGMGHNELLIREAIKGVPRDRVFIAVKFGALRDHKGGFNGEDSRPVAESWARV